MSQKPPAVTDLSDGLSHCRIQLERLALNRQDFLVLQWLRTYGYSRWEDLDLEGLRQLYKDLKLCQPGPLQKRVERLEGMVRELVGILKEDAALWQQQKLSEIVQELDNAAR